MMATIDLLMMFIGGFALGYFVLGPLSLAVWDYFNRR